MPHILRPGLWVHHDIDTFPDKTSQYCAEVQPAEGGRTHSIKNPKIQFLEGGEYLRTSRFDLGRVPCYPWAEEEMGTGA